MHCPYCRSDDTKVIDSRDSEEGRAVRRRRECIECSQRFTTFERYEGVPLLVRKRDGTRQPFDRAKVISGIAKACTNRPVTDGQMLAICDEVEEATREKGAEVASEDIGHEVLVRLKEVDDVAYVRFASVYQEFEDVTEFGRVISELEGVRGSSSAEGVAIPRSAWRGSVGGRG